MKAIKKLLLIFTIALSAICLFSCGLFQKPEEEKFEVVFVEEYDIPAVRLGVEYDFAPYFTHEDGVTYSMTAIYLDDDLNEIELDVDGFKFTQNEFSNIFVTITATKDGKTVTGEMEIPVDTTYDAADYWVVDSLYAGTGMNKSLNYLPAYRTSLDSLTSAKYTYKGTAKKDAPVTVMSLMDWPNNSRLTVSDWSNAVIVMDIYNTSEKNMTIGLVAAHSLGVSYSFDQCDKFVCEPNEWTRIEYSLKALNFTEEFVFNSDWDLSDKILIQSVYEGANAEESTKTYSYSFYVDNVDICDYSSEKFPDLDTTTYKEYEDFFTKDDMLSGVVNNDYDNKQRNEDLYNTTELVEYSNKSIKFVLSEDGSSANGFLHSFIGGTPTGWLPMDITEATMSFYIRMVNADSTFVLKFESDYNIFANPIEIDLTKASGAGWTVTEEQGWHKVEIDVDQANIETALVRMDFIRTMRLYFSNTTAQAGSESAIYLDTLKLEGWKVTSAQLDEKNPWETKSPYTAMEDKDMFSTDENLVFNINYERQDTISIADINERMEGSSYSYKLVLPVNGTVSNAIVDSFFTGKPSDWTIMDISNATISFGVKSVNADNVFYVSFASDYNENGLILGRKVAIDLSQTSGEGWTVTQLENGWSLVTLDIQNANITDEVLGVTKDFIKIMRIEFSNAAATTDSESVIYIDSLSVEGAVATSAPLDEENPWGTKSPYVNYVVTFKNADGSIISQTNYHYGDTVVEPENPSMPGGENECTFTFLGWDYTVTAVNCDATYTATYSLTSMSDLWNCTLENGGIDSITNDTEVKSENSSYSLNIVEPITSGNLPYFALTLDKTYDLTGKCIVFDFKDIAKDGWLVGFDFVNNGSKVGLWNMHTLKSGEKSASHKCEDLGDGWLRVYIYVDELSSSMNSVTAIYFTLNASDGEGTLNLHFDNLHFEEKPAISTYMITFKDYDGRVISSAEYEEGATVTVPDAPIREAIVGECTYTFAGWDYEVTAANCDATYTATYSVASVDDLWNCAIDNGGIDNITNDAEVKAENSAHSLKIVEPISSGNLPYFALTLDKTYDLTGKYMVFDTNISKDGWLVVFDFVNNGGKLGLWNMLTIKSGTEESTHKCEDLGNGWLRVYVDVDVLNGSLNSVSKIYVTLNASDGSGTLEFNLDNLHFENKPEVVLPTETDDSIGACGLVAVNGGSASIVTDTVSSNSEKAAKFNVPAGNSGVWWNYDVDVASLLGKGLDLSGKTVTFDVKIVGNMTWVGFTVADGNGKYATPNGENYAWMNLSNGWSGFGMSIAAIENGWFRVSLTPDTSFGDASGNLAKLRFLVNPQDGNEANMYIDNLYLGELKGYEAPVRTEADDYVGKCGLIAVNGGSIALDTSVVSTNSEKSIKCTIPAGNSGVWWNYDISLREFTTKGSVDLSGKTITFDVKIVGNMSLVGFTVADGNDQYAQPDGEAYIWTNLTDGWGADKGWVVTAMDNGWFRVSFTVDTKFFSCSNNVAKFRFLVNPQDGNEASLYIDNLYLD